MKKQPKIRDTSRWLVAHPSTHEFLDGYGGADDWEWTKDRRTAWSFTKEEALRRLDQVSKVRPLVEITLR